MDSCSQYYSLDAGHTDPVSSAALAGACAAVGAAAAIARGAAAATLFERQLDGFPEGLGWLRPCTAACVAPQQHHEKLKMLGLL